MTSTAKARPRNARLEARVPSDQKDFFQRAATLSGRTLSEFVIESTQKAAIQVVQEYDLVRLSREQQIAFVSALLEAPQPGARLSQAAESYRRKAGLECH
ncbi:DUF1778 domain-containing protein [Oxalobacteraceae bacterium A2-2]